MEQVESGSNARRRHGGIGVARQGGLRLVAALVAAGLNLACAGGGGSAPPVVSKFNSSLAWAQLLKQTSFGPRVPGTAAHVECRDYLLAEFKKYTDDARLQEFTHTWSSDGKPKPMWNIIGEMNWKDAPVRVALFAHWDSRPTADYDPVVANRKKPVLGANDGASGVAVLLELMRVFKEAKLPVGVQFVLTDGEDLGPSISEMFLGAKHYAGRIGTPRPDYGILLDMIGDKDLRVPVEPNSWNYAESVVRAVYGHAAKIGLGSTFPMEFGPTIEDDHVPLNEAGLPTIDLIDFTYDSWHTIHDTPDKCSPESLGKVGKLLETFLLSPTPFKP